MLNLLKWPNINQLVNSAIINLAKNATCYQSSAGINELFNTSNPRNKRTGHAMRISHKGKINATESFETKAVMLFNQLPAEIRNHTWKTTNFKAKLKTHLSQQYLLTKHQQKKENKKKYLASLSPKRDKHLKKRRKKIQPRHTIPTP